MAPQRACTHKHRTTDRTTNLLISSNVHYVHLAEIMNGCAVKTFNPAFPRSAVIFSNPSQKQAFEIITLVHFCEMGYNDVNMSYDRSSRQPWTNALTV